MSDREFLRDTVEKYVDKLYLNSALLRQSRDVATLHLLRTFEDAMRSGAIRGLTNGEDFRFYQSMRWAHEALPWALRWVWARCSGEEGARLDLDWNVYEDAGQFLLLSAKYYQIYRCFVLFSRGAFSANVDPERRLVRFSFTSSENQRRDGVRQVREMVQDSSAGITDALRSFMKSNWPVINVVFPHYIDKAGENAIRYTAPPEVSERFARWATLQMRGMRFDLPGSWEFGGYNLHQFRSLWRSMLTLSLTHNFAHLFAYEAVGVKGGAVESVIINVGREQLVKMGALFGVPDGSCQSILDDITYNPLGEYWDPFWQPLIRISNGTYLISPSLIMTSSPERNLVVALNRNPAKRELYSRVSAQKEAEQLAELRQFFESNRYTQQERVTLNRANGTILTDIDVLVYDRVERFLLLVQVKWLLRPDNAMEVLSKDREISDAISVVRAAGQRVEELGPRWLSDVLRLELSDEPVKVKSLLVNRDFLPGGWVYDDIVPVVDLQFLRDFFSSQKYGLSSLYEAAMNIDKSLGEKHLISFGRTEIEFGDYIFEVPTIKRQG